MKRSEAIAAGAALLLACAFAAQAQEKISDGVVKIGMLEDMSSMPEVESRRGPAVRSHRPAAQLHLK